MTTIQKTTQKQRTFSRISFKERVIIENRYCTDRRTLSDIAKELSRPVCTIVREIDDRPRIGRGKYTADKAQSLSEEKRMNQGRGSKLVYEPLRVYVIMKLKIGWSPEQIEWRLPREHPHDKNMRISYEAIYQYVYAQVHRGGNGKVREGCEDLRPYLARRHARRQQKGFRQTRKVYRPELPSIDDRPRVVDKRKELGHWEDDCIVSRESTVRLKTMNERVSGIILIRKMKNGTIQESNRAVASCMSTIPSRWRKTLTRDRGTENMGYLDIEKELKMQCFFAHAYCSQERGSNENGNGLIRRPYPKKTDFALVSNEAISNLEYLLNSRPRKRLGGKTPYEVFYEHTGVALDY